MKRIGIFLMVLLVLGFSFFLYTVIEKKQSDPEHHFLDELVFENVFFSDATYEYDGSVKKIEVVGLIEGATVVYENNEAIEIGIYKAKATITKQGYKTLVLKATLTIKKSSVPV